MDAFLERMSRLAELNADELNDLVNELVAAFNEADTAGDVSLMQQLADGLDEARAALAEKQPAEEAPVDEAPAPDVAPVPDLPVAASAAEETEAPANAEAPAPAGDDAEAETPAEDADADAEAVADDSNETIDSKSAAEDAAENVEETSVENLTADEVPENNVPVAASAPPVTIRAGGDIPGITSGTELSDMDQVVEMLTRKVNAMRGVSGDGEQITVASMRVEGELPDERVLRAGDAHGNSKKIRSLLAAGPEALSREGLVAAAWCAPRAPIYDVPTMGVADRPVANALPTFNADRGGATWMQPPALPDLSPAVALWTWDETDERWESRTGADGGGTSGTLKPSLAVPCGDEKYADVEAVTQSLCFDNMTARAFPEWIRGNTDLTLVAQARFAEQHLLARMFGAITATGCGEPSVALGASRDFLTTVKTTAASKRWRFRLGANAPLQLFAPSWVREAIAVDLTIQAPGDQTFDTALSEVDGYLSNANIDAVWFIDDAPGQDPFDTCVAFPTEAHWLLFPTGSFIRLDSGSLDLGVVRTKEDIQKNTYCQFAETFETAAYMGPGSPNQWATHGVTPIVIQGNTAGPVDTTGS